MIFSKPTMTLADKIILITFTVLLLTATVLPRVAILGMFVAPAAAWFALRRWPNLWPHLAKERFQEESNFYLVFVFAGLAAFAPVVVVAAEVLPLPGHPAPPYWIWAAYLVVAAPVWARALKFALEPDLWAECLRSQAPEHTP